MLRDEYIRLGSALQQCSVDDLLKRVDIELSKNNEFTVMQLRASPKDVAFVP